MLQRPSRAVWIAAIVVSIVSVVALGYAFVTEWDTEPDSSAMQSRGNSNGSGFGIGLMIGIGAGIAIGSLLVLRKK